MVTPAGIEPAFATWITKNMHYQWLILEIRLAMRSEVPPSPRPNAHPPNQRGYLLRATARGTVSELRRANICVI